MRRVLRWMLLGWVLCAGCMALVLAVAPLVTPDYGIIYERRFARSNPPTYYLHDPLTGVQNKLPIAHTIQLPQESCAPDACYLVMQDALGNVRDYSPMVAGESIGGQFPTSDGRIGLLLHDWRDEHLTLIAVDRQTGAQEIRYQLDVPLLDDVFVQGDIIALALGNTLRVHDIETGAERTRTTFDAVPQDVQVSPDGRWVAARENRLNGTFWLHWVEMATGEKQSYQLAGVSQYEWSADNDLLFWHVNDPRLFVCTIRLFRLDPQTQTRETLPVRLECRNMTDDFTRTALYLSADDPNRAVSFSPDHRYLVVRRGVDAMYQLLDLVSDAPPVTLPFAFHQWTPDSRYLVGATQTDPRLTLVRYDVQTGRILPYTDLPQVRRVRTIDYDELMIP